MKKRLIVLIVCLCLFPVFSVCENNTRVSVGRCSFFIYDDFFEVTKTLGDSLLQNLNSPMKETSRVFMNTSADTILIGKIAIAEPGQKLYENEAELFVLANDAIKGFQGESSVVTLGKAWMNHPCMTIADNKTAWNFVFFPEEIVYYYVNANDQINLNFYQFGFNSVIIY